MQEIRAVIKCPIDNEFEFIQYCIQDCDYFHKEVRGMNGAKGDRAIQCTYPREWQKEQEG